MPDKDARGRAASFTACIGLIGTALWLPACAARAPVMPPAPTTLSYPDFLYPQAETTAPPALAEQLERGWRYLQASDLRRAGDAFTAAVGADPTFHPAHTALGYVEVARKDYSDALPHFARALEADAGYVPALVGQGHALLGLEREADALASYEAALSRDPQVAGLQSRIDMLRLRAMQRDLARGQAAADQGDWEAARSAYRGALAASPESAFLHRELGSVEHRAGQPEAALLHMRRALALDPADARTHAAVGALLEEQGDAAGAVEAYEKAAQLDPAVVPEARLVRAREAAALGKLPPEYRAIASVAAITRADVAALLGVQLNTLVTSAQRRQVVITDVRGHWAQPWITEVVRAGLMDTLPNSTFQPAATVRRGELAQTIDRALGLIAAGKPAIASKWRRARVTLPDLSPHHLAYPAVSAAVASGVMSLDPNGTFDLLRPVSGAEAVAIVDRLEALAAP